jgi:hypothetical protein
VPRHNDAEAVENAIGVINQLLDEGLRLQRGIKQKGA